MGSSGRYGPDCGLTRAPYVWRYRYRSTITGERGNPSPSMRAGIPARRQRVQLVAAGCVEDQCDVIARVDLALLEEEVANTFSSLMQLRARQHGGDRAFGVEQRKDDVVGRALGSPS